MILQPEVIWRKIGAAPAVGHGGWRGTARKSDCAVLGIRLPLGPGHAAFGEFNAISAPRHAARRQPARPPHAFACADAAPAAGARAPFRASPAAAAGRFVR